MTFYETIYKILESNNIRDKLSQPINVVISSYNANYVDVAFNIDKKSIDKILSDDIPNYQDLAIEYINEQNEIISLSYDLSYKLRTNDNSLNIQEHLSHYTAIGRTKLQDDEFIIYLSHPHKYERETEVKGFLRTEYFVHDDCQYEVDKIKLPVLEEYKYQNLYNYKEENEFFNAILFEFINRHIDYNDILTDRIPFNNLDKEEDLDLRLDDIIVNHEEEENKILFKYFGLTSGEVKNLRQVYSHSFRSVLENKNITLQIQLPPSKEACIDLTLSKEKLIEKIISLKENFDNEINASIDFKEKLNTDYLNHVYEIIGKFPKKFEIKQDHLIKALYIFDYIQAKKIYIDKSNNMPHGANKDDQLSYPKMNPKNKNSIFNEIAQKINIKVGQAKKLYYHIDKFLKITISQ